MTGETKGYGQRNLSRSQHVANKKRKKRKWKSRVQKNFLIFGGFFLYFFLAKIRHFPNAVLSSTEQRGNHQSLGMSAPFPVAATTGGWQMGKPRTLARTRARIRTRANKGNNNSIKSWRPAVADKA